MSKISQVSLKYTGRLNGLTTNHWSQLRYIQSWEKKRFCTHGGVSQQDNLRLYCCKPTRLFATSSQRNFIYLSSCVSPKLWEPRKLPVFIGNQYFHIDQTNRISSRTGAEEQLVPTNLSKNEYEQIAEETLESLTGYFDEIVEKSTLEDADISCGSGVLTIKLSSFGTYVINKQTPNKQIWLSSPTSGPKRYDFINDTWIYKHDGMSLYHLLNTEIPRILKVSDIDFEENCSYGKAKKNK